MDQAPPASELNSPSSLASNVVVAGSTTGGGNVPTGCVAMYINATPPTGWLLCNGTAVSRTTYAALFTVIGTTYGSGDGSTTFNLPDMQGRVPVGVGTHADVVSLASNDGVSVANRRPKHRHTPHTHSHSGQSAVYNAGSGSAAGVATTSGTAAEASYGSADGGSGNANDSLDAPAYLVLEFIIRT